MTTRVICIVAGLLFLSGCAHLEFTDYPNDGNGGVAFYEATPYLFVSTTSECVRTASLIMLPAKKKMVKFHMGYGSSELSVGLTNGMISSVGLKADTKIPETIGAITGLGAMAAGLPKAPGVAKGLPCPSALLYEIKDGKPSDTPITLKP